MLAVLFGKGWLWNRCGVCGGILFFWKRTQTMKYMNHLEQWESMLLCVQCAFDFMKMELRAKANAWRKNRTH